MQQFRKSLIDSPKIKLFIDKNDFILIAEAIDICNTKYFSTTSNSLTS